MQPPPDTAGLVARFERRVRNLARRLEPRDVATVDDDDLYQEGMIALLAAAQRSDASKGSGTSFLLTRARGAMVDYMRSASPLSRITFARLNDMRRVEAEHLEEHGARPTDAQVAAALNLTVGKIREARRSAMLAAGASLDMQMTDGDGSAEIGEMLADGTDIEADALLAEEYAELRAAVRRLRLAERVVITQTFFAGQTQVEIARALGVGDARVSQIKTAAIARLRALLRPHAA